MNYHIYYHKTTGKKVQTITRATAVPSMQDVICYQELHDEFEFYVMSREDFLKEFTRELDGLPAFPRKEIEKRAEITQKIKRIEAKEEPEQEEKVNDLLMRFLDAETNSEKINILRREKDKLDDHILNSIAVCLDLTIDDEDGRYEYIIQHLELQKRYEGSRLR